MSVLGTVPEPQVCEQARLSRDPRFDGLFFTAVTSTRIYCRPTCPAPTPKPENIRYFPSAAAAESAGFRPCLRCRPELAPGDHYWQRGDMALSRALRLLDEGFLADHSVAELAARVRVSERQLRRRFVERLGASPLRVYSTQRLLFAKQLLTETDLSITEVALEAGFGSLRRFNAAFRDSYRMAPRELRRRPNRRGKDVLVLRLSYRPPYNFASVLKQLRHQLMPGVEHVDGQSYQRILGPADTPGWLRVSAWPGEDALQLELRCPQPTRILNIVTRLKRMFDLNAVPHIIFSALSQDDLLKPHLMQNPGLRLAGCWDAFECVIATILCKHLGPTRAHSTLRRLSESHGTFLATDDGYQGYQFPTLDALIGTDLKALGLTSECVNTIDATVRALLEGRVTLGTPCSLDAFVAQWTALSGIDAWTAHTIALRAFGHPDAFPLDPSTPYGAPPGIQALQGHADQWRPWRAYALTLLSERRDSSETVSNISATLAQSVLNHSPLG